jgi:hypothetical protein
MAHPALLTGLSSHFIPYPSSATGEVNKAKMRVYAGADAPA